MHQNMSCMKWRPFCPRGDELMCHNWPMTTSPIATTWRYVDYKISRKKLPGHLDKNKLIQTKMCLIYQPFSRSSVLSNTICFPVNSTLSFFLLPSDSNKSLGKILNNDGHFKRIRCPFYFVILQQHGPLTRCVKLWVGHAPGILGTFPCHRGLAIPTCITARTCVMHVPWCMSVSLTSGSLWNRWRGNRSRHSRRIRNPQFYVSGKRPIVLKGESIKTTTKVSAWASNHIPFCQ